MYKAVSFHLYRVAGLNTVMGGLSIYELALILNAAIGEPPETPPGCVDLILGCIYALLSPSGALTHRTLVDCRFLFNKVMRFLTIARTHKDRTLLGETLMACRCRNPETPCLVRKSPVYLHSHMRPDHSFSSLTDRLHHPGRGLAAVITQSCHLVSRAFNAMKLARLHGLYRLEGNDQTSWPACLDDICPFPITSSLEMVGAWTRAFEKDEPAHWLGNIMNSTVISHKTDAIPAIWASHSLWYWIRRHTRRESSALSVAVSKPAVDSVMAASHLSSIVEAADLLSQTTRLLSRLELFRWLADVNKGNSDFGMSRILRLCDQATRAVTIATEFFRHDQALFDILSRGFDLCHREFPELAGILHAVMSIRMKLVVPVAGFCPLLVSEIDRLTKYEKDPWLDMVYKGFNTPWVFRCYGPRCFRTYVSEKRKFRVCGGCMKAAYCCRRCQRAAWNHRHSPHREVCHVYKEVARLENQAKIDGTLPSRLQILRDSLRALLLASTPDLALAAVNNINRLSDNKFVLRRKSTIIYSNSPAKSNFSSLR